MARPKIIEKTQPNENGLYLNIFETSYGLRGDVRRKGEKRVVMSAYFYEKDGDASVYRVKEYFNFK